MATESDITGFYEGEDVVIDFYANDRDGTDLTDPDNATVTILISETVNGTATLEYNDKSTLVSLPEALFRITLQPTDLTTITPGQIYYYYIWTTDLSNVDLLQVTGAFVYKKSVQPS